MQVFKASDLQREGARVFDAVEATGSVKVQSKTREPMFLLTGEQIKKLLSSKTQREVMAAELQA